MKELTIEEKAKAYDEVLKQIKECTPDENGFITIYPQKIFPELKESGDERIWLTKHLQEEIDCLRYDIRDYKDSAKIDNLQRALDWLEKQGEQKDTWSEEDDKILKSIIINIENLQFSEDMREKYHHIPNANKSYYQIKIDWLKSLKDRVQPKQEWNEEDMKMIGTLVAIFEVNYPDSFYKVNPIGTTNMQGIHSSEIIKWLKSIKERVVPQQKQEWSEEDESLRRRCIGAIDIANLSDYTKDSLLNWLKSLRPQNTWKPSLSQLNALGVVAKGNPPDDIEEIKSLYNDLHKLIN